MRSAGRLVVFLVAVFLLSAAPAFGETPTGVVRGFLALAYDGRFDELPKAPGARTERFERQVRNVLRVRCIRADAIAIAVIEERPEQVTLHADVAIAKRDSQRSEAWSSVDIVPLRFELTRQGDSWLVAEVRDRDEEHAERVLRASGEERERLLREQPERLSKGLARALYARTLAHMNSGEFKEAKDAGAVALRVAVEAGDRGGEALALGLLAHMHPNDRERFSLESVAIAETLGDPDILARAWYDRGRNLKALRSRSDSANEHIECYRKARRFAERAEDATILVRILYSLANLTVHRLSDNLTARRYIDEGLSIAREVGDETGEMGLEMILAIVYGAQGDLERGLFHHARATSLAEKTNALAHPTLLVQWGCLLVDQGRHDEARAMFARAVVRTESGMKSTFKSMPPRTIGSALRCMAVTEAHLGNFSEAECLNREGAMLNGDDPNSYLYELAPQYASHGNDAGALALSLASLTRPDHDETDVVAALLGAGRACRRMGIVDRGLAVALEAIAIREELDARVAGDEQQRANAARSTSECYELAAELTLAKGDPVEALVLLERGRARVLTDIVENGRPASAAQLDRDVRERQAALDREVVRIRTELDRAQAAGNKATGDQLERLNRARAVRASFLDGVRARSQRRDAVRRQIDAAAINGLAARLPPRTVAVEYFAGEHDLYIFLLGQHGITVRTKRVARSDLDARVDAFLEMLASSDLRVGRVARELHALLIEPIEKDIAGADALLIVPDDSLWRVPFAALVDRRERFLVESKTIFYAPSMMAYASIVDARKRSDVPRGSLLAIANPTLDPVAGKVAASFYRNATLGPLPDAEHEVDALRTLYDPRQSLVLKRHQATEARTKTALRDAAVAHFATHAILDDANPAYSRLMLARDGEAEEDGWLESWEVARLDLNADLVVLAACETARGRVGGGEGVVGLSWSFFLAGASSTLVTQWKVASDSTAAFMIAFHRSLRTPAMTSSLHKARAVRDAQLQCIRDKRTAHPFHWASFVLLGDPSIRVEH